MQPFAAPYKPSVLFVCTANQIRSPIAQAVFLRLLGGCVSDTTGWRVESAGTWTDGNRKPVARAVKVMQSRGFDISRHRSRVVNRELLESFNLILTMERNHKEALQIEFPQCATRVYLLSEMCDQVKDVPDPIGKPVEIYETAIAAIENYLQTGCRRIIDLACR
jgi:protein-tyrosine-phosphatase